MPLYFAYGSNLDADAMRLRCPSSRVRCRACLPGHRVTFPLACPSWGGGVAGVEPDLEDEVHGVVYEMTDEDLQPLDAYEDVAGGDYERRLVTVRGDDGRTLETWTYFALVRQPDCPPPSRRYLDTIVRGARYHGLPDRYVAKLAAIPACDDGRGDTPVYRRSLQNLRNLA